MHGVGDISCVTFLPDEDPPCCRSGAAQGQEVLQDCHTKVRYHYGGAGYWDIQLTGSPPKIIKLFCLKYMYMKVA